MLTSSMLGLHFKMNQNPKSKASTNMMKIQKLENQTTYLQILIVLLHFKNQKTKMIEKKWKSKPGISEKKYMTNQK